MATRSITRPQLQLLRGLVDFTPRTYCFHRSTIVLPRCRRSSSSAQLLHTRKLVEAVGAKKAADAESEELRAISKLSAVLQDALRLLESPNPPEEGKVLEALVTCEDLARYFKKSAETSIAGAAVQGVVAVGQGEPSNPAANLLFLDENQHPSSSRSQASIATLSAAMREKAVERLTRTAYTIISNPNVFITPKLLQSYLTVQTLLNRPETLSQVFNLYANKPVPKPKTSPVEYRAASPNRASSAIPLGIANAALDSAIQVRNLPLCLDIINCTVRTPAFRRHKVIQKALLPGVGLALAPVAAYTLASQLSLFQDTMSHEMATNVAFAGILSYVGFTATIGVVAMTTANDQMDRVTWATGTPLRDRWLREEERAMIDRVAGAWGFKESWRRGEEEGREWDALREFTGLRGMVLDKVELMEGME